MALFFGVVFAASSAALIGIIDFTALSSLTKLRDAAITAELRELNPERASGFRIDEMRRAIVERDNAPNKAQFIYALYDKDNRLLAGTPLRVPRIDGWSDIGGATGDPDDQTHIIHFRSAVLAGGYRLAVGEDTDQVDDIHEFLSTTFYAAPGGALLLALGGAGVLSWSLRKRLNRVSSVCQEIMAGNLSLRVPTGFGDEIDLLAGSINAMLDRIVGLMDTLQQVTIDVAHDMRTPLARMRQGLESVELKAKTTGDYSTAVRKAMGEIDTVLDTFAALLRIAELQAGNLRSTFGAVDLSHTLQNVADAYAPSADENGQRIETHIAPGIRVTGDENLLTQMAANLVANALRHTPAGTIVDIRLSSTGSRPQAAISDNGPGIPEADRQRVFQRFVRLERSRSAPGSGLGLSVSAAIAELHGVTIELQDNGPGLRCELTFP